MRYSLKKVFVLGHKSMHIWLRGTPIVSAMLFMIKVIARFAEIGSSAATTFEYLICWERFLNIYQKMWFIWTHILCRMFLICFLVSSSTKTIFAVERSPAFVESTQVLISSRLIFQWFHSLFFLLFKSLSISRSKILMSNRIWWFAVKTALN